MPRHRVVLLVYPRFQSLDLAGPYEAFAGADAVLGRRAYDLIAVAMSAGTVVSESGLEVVVRAAVDEITGPIGTLLVVGGDGVIEARDDADLVDWVRHAARRAGRVASVCSGAFVLAAAGLLDGRRVTTHWRRAPRLAREHPELDVDPDPIFIRSDHVWTSAGVTAGIDLALAMVEADHGAGVAQEVARSLVMFLRRPGGQSQFATAVWSDAAEHRPVRAALDLIHRDPAADLSVAHLARAAAMSERHFLRVFTREVACTPAAYVERMRVEAARRQLEESEAGVDVIAQRAGFGSAETMRRAFIRRLGVPPTDYRRRFAAPTRGATA